MQQRAPGKTQKIFRATHCHFSPEALPRVHCRPPCPGENREQYGGLNEWPVGAALPSVNLVVIQIDLVVQQAVPLDQSPLLSRGAPLYWAWTLHPAKVEHIRIQATIWGTIFYPLAEHLALWTWPMSGTACISF